MIIKYPTLYGKIHEEEFTVQGPWDSGGFSFIYEVLSSKSLRFAAKIVKSEDATNVSSIRHEGNILSQLQGDNIVRLIYFHDGTVYDDLPPYLILEWAED